MHDGSRRTRMATLAAAGTIISSIGLMAAAPGAGASTAHERPRATTSGCTAQTTNSGKWVCAVYEVVLNRTPDPAGQAKWDTALNNGETRAQVAHSIVSSTEYRSDFIEADYQAYLGRDADQAGMNALQNMFSNSATDEQVDSVLLGSAEYYSKHGGTTNAFVNALYEDILGRPADSGGLSKWSAALANGESRRSVAFSIDCSQESRSNLVEYFYETFLSRPADQAGLQHWVSELNAGMTDEDVISALLGSAEFYKDVTGVG